MRALTAVHVSTQPAPIVVTVQGQGMVEQIAPQVKHRRHDVFKVFSTKMLYALFV